MINKFIIIRAELGVIFGLSWFITWYSHVSDDIKVILRLFDFFIASDPMIPIYLGAIVIIIAYFFYHSFNFNILDDM